MSGVMLKVAIYGLVRLLFGFFGIIDTGAEMWWGILILVLGMFSAVLGVLYSLLEHDLKRLLAMHSIENIGIIFIGLGAAVLFSWARLPELAALALFASLYHTLNHALFKSLLFLGAGSVAYSTHERNIEELGGLAKLMPVTAILFLLGSASIAAIPPLNGFVSELLTFEALLGGIGSSTALSLLLSLAVLFLALTSALAVGAFVKAFGIPFLGLPRSSHATKAREAPKTMLAGMALLALGCIAAGALPATVAQASLGIFDTLNFPASGSSIVTAAEGLQTSTILLALVLGSIVVGGAIWFAGRGRPHESGDTWACGFIPVTPRMQYSAAGFAMPVTRALNAWLDPLSKPAAYGSALFDYVIYSPLSRLFHSLAPYSAVFHTGKLSDYLMYLMVTLALVLIYAVS
jgi:hydrogenase-4 component B